MKWLAIGLFLVGVGLGAGGTVGYERLSHTRTQLVAVCDQRGNTVYTSSAGGVFVMKGC